jgi:hypothetical protein
MELLGLLGQMVRQARQELLARLARAVRMEQGQHITDKSPESQTAQLTLQQQALTNQLD